jgi:hypothetical protein
MDSFSPASAALNVSLWGGYIAAKLIAGHSFGPEAFFQLAINPHQDAMPRANMPCHALTCHAMPCPMLHAVFLSSLGIRMRCCCLCRYSHEPEQLSSEPRHRMGALPGPVIPPTGTSSSLPGSYAPNQG